MKGVIVIRITYWLSPAGQADALRRGLNAKASQEVSIPHGHPLYDRALKVARVYLSGQAEITLWGYGRSIECYKVPTIERLIELAEQYPPVYPPKAKTLDESLARFFRWIYGLSAKAADDYLRVGLLTFWRLVIYWHWAD